MSLASSNTIYVPRQDLRILYAYSGTDTALGYGLPFFYVEGYDGIVVEFTTSFANWEHMAFAYGVFGNGAVGLIVSKPKIVAARNGRPATGIFQTMGGIMILSLYLTMPIFQTATRSMVVYGLPEYKDWM